MWFLIDCYWYLVIIDSLVGNDLNYVIVNFVMFFNLYVIGVSC